MTKGETDPKSLSAKAMQRRAALILLPRLRNTGILMMAIGLTSFGFAIFSPPEPRTINENPSPPEDWTLAAMFAMLPDEESPLTPADLTIAHLYAAGTSFSLLGLIALAYALRYRNKEGAAS